MSHELGTFSFISPSNTVHIINHNLNTQKPILIIYEQITNKILIPIEIDSTNPNQIIISFFIARAIYGGIRK